ncbi:MAG TPA: hypothetical protein DCO79_16765, partial [Spirochaeta sp.]|nr:hypothetical protein [Spirochaeta sp.]
MKLIFNIENNKEKKELLYICTPGEDIQKHFAAEIRKLWPEIRLPSNGLLSFDIKDAAPIIKSKKPLTINGVAVQDRTLKKNDRIIFGALRLNYLAFETVQTETEAGDDMLTRRLPEFKFEWRTHPLKA